MPNNGKDIEKAKQQAIDALNARIGDMDKEAYNILLKAIEREFDIKAGKIQGGKGFVNQLNKLSVGVLDLLQTEPKFTGPVSQFIKRMPAIAEEISAFQKSVNGITVPAFETAKKIVIDEIIDKMLNNGLNQKFVIPLRDLIYRNVTSGLSLSDARAQIKDFIQGGKDESGKLGQYIEQTAIQAADSYSGAINVKLLQTFDYDGLQVVGTLIDNSSPQCRFAKTDLHSIITRDNWAKVKAIGEKQSGWIPGTNFDNLPLNRLHWGCRHEFGPIIIKKTA